MNSNQLTKAQAKAMHAALLPTLRYLNRLAERLNARSFPWDDRLIERRSRRRMRWATW